MSLSLKTAAPAQGALWVRDGFRLFARHPLAFSSLFAAFMITLLVASLVPLAGGLLSVAAVPLLPLGYMVAAEAALAGGAVHPGHLIAPLRGPRERRAALLRLCMLFMALMIPAMLLCNYLDSGQFERLQQLMADRGRQKEVDAIMADSAFQGVLLLRCALIVLISIPFWHAPALVHWSGQGIGQALFSSTLAIWRCKAAFVVYVLTWIAIVVLFGLVAAVLLRLVGQPGLVGLVSFPAGLILTTVFYVSLIFTFRGSFGGIQEPPAA
ncbi:MAG: BPSS1780 family membrane protein [Rubrivivax sp.]